MTINLPWLRCYVGRDVLRGAGWSFWMLLFPRPDLMERGEEGEVILSALSVEAWATWRVFGRFRPRLCVWTRCDVDEITRRIAERAGQYA